jgi:hypothetical protein
MRPGIYPIGFWMPAQVEYLDDAIPHRLTLKRLRDWHTLDMLRFGFVQPVDHIPQLVDMAHD